MKDATITTEPMDTDVLCGRGAAVTKHIGNRTYIKLVKFNKVRYATSSIPGKGQISRSIVIAIHEIGGRFLVEDKNRSSTQGQEGQRFWVEIGDKKATEKISQALRENQPKVRQQLQESILRYKKKNYILPFTTNKHHLSTTKSAGVENSSAKVVATFCKDDDVNEWTWMKKFHKRAFKAWIEIKRR
ncbi:hypothetical protein FRACYDRAFT_233159 [Fragilariopsis cylindrus CCMP1102]|uniref:DUF6824 domain-containing protein n=1 Tax=Fragilariopsis cylindrus CCMP1102 TaxID=635003 RepID=A0A1E7FXX9_9STRA|nr:hypothetical protein FRACYDRAFT_233159 [Fragilariopsis cylindrus CCMP1102]|eukprot:OEU22995.1 hypothetical protein FRACYDRAFT_233159 [Fragilariopsis cylindrus CCMP1102]